MQLEGLRAYIARQLWASPYSRLIDVGWDALGQRLAAQVASYSDRHPNLARAALRWDDTGQQSAVIISSDGAADEESFFDFSDMLETVFEREARTIREALGEEVYSGAARLLTLVCCQAWFEWLSARGGDSFVLHVSYLHGESPALAWGDGHCPSAVFAANGDLQLPASPQQRFEAAVEAGDCAAIERLTPALCRSNDSLVVMAAQSQLFAACARGELDLSHEDLMALLRSVKLTKDAVGDVFGDDLDKIVGNAVVCAARDEEAYGYVDNQLVAPDTVRLPQLAGNMACVAALQTNKPRLLVWARAAVERGKSAEELLADSDLQAYRDDPDLLRALEGVGKTPEALGDELHDAASDLDIEAMKRLIAAGAPVDHEKDWESVYEAALGSFGGRRSKKANADEESPKVTALRLLLDAGADVDLDVGDVVFRGTEIVQLYLERGAEPDLRALCAAVEKGNIELVDLFLQAGVSMSPLESDEESPLCRVHYNKNADELFDYLVERGAVPGEGSSSRLLHNCAATNTPSLIRKLIVDLGWDAGKRDEQGNTALGHAAFNDNEECAKLLLELGCPVNARNGDGRTILSDMNIGNGPNVFKAALDAGADPTLADNDGNTPLHHAADAGRVAMVRALLDHGASTDALNKAGKRPVDLSDNRQVRDLLA